MDPTDPFAGATDIGSGAVTSADQNPSNGLGAADLLSQLIGTAGNVAVANQVAAGQVAQAQYASKVAATNSGSPLAVLETNTGLSGGVLLLICVPCVFLIALRK